MVRPGGVIASGRFKRKPHRQTTVCLPATLHNLGWRTAAGELADTHTAQQTSHTHTHAANGDLVTLLFSCFGKPTITFCHSLETRK